MKAKVGIIMGSQSDAGVMKAAADVLKDFGVPFEVNVISAHRTPDEMKTYANGAEARGIKVIIAGAGGAAHLPGMVASMTVLPVIGVPVALDALKGLDSLLSIAQMPKGIPVASMAIDNSHNAGLLAVRILALENSKWNKALHSHLKKMKAKVKKSRSSVKKLLVSK